MIYCQLDLLVDSDVLEFLVELLYSINELVLERQRI